MRHGPLMVHTRGTQTATGKLIFHLFFDLAPFQP